MGRGARCRAIATAVVIRMSEPEARQPGRKACSEMTTRRRAGFAKTLRSWYIEQSARSESNLRKLRNQTCR